MAKNSTIETLKAFAPVSKGVLVGGGVLGAIWIAKGAPALDDKDRRNLLVATLGILGFGALTVTLCTYTNQSFCEGVPKLGTGL